MFPQGHDLWTPRRASALCEVCIFLYVAIILLIALSILRGALLSTRTLVYNLLKRTRG